MLYLSAIVFLPLTLAAVSGSRLTERATCDDVHLFLARGRGESYPGRVGGLADSVCSGLPSCSYENIMFTSVAATLYCDSAAEGAANGVAQIQAYHAQCPNSQLVVGGYSLGAQVVGDLLGGGGGNFYNCAEAFSGPLDPNSSAAQAIVAVIMFGDTRHVANQPYNAGDGSGDNGQYPRSGAQLAGLNAFSSKIQNYCMASDPICALGNDGLSHETYVTVFGPTAGAWVKGRLNKPATKPTTSAVVVSSTSSKSSSAVVGVSTSSSAVVGVSTSSSVPAATSGVTTGSAPASSSLAPFDFSSSVTSAPPTSPTGTFTPYSFQSTNLTPVTAASLPALATATSVPALATQVPAVATQPGGSAYPVGTGTGVGPAKSNSPTTPYYGGASPTPSAFVGAGSKAMEFSASLIGLAVAGALLL